MQYKVNWKTVWPRQFSHGEIKRGQDHVVAGISKKEIKFAGQRANQIKIEVVLYNNEKRYEYGKFTVYK